MNLNESIRIKGAREHNLKNISLDIPKHKFVVLTGPSGSGKSTLALDTLQRECQRQYMESMGMVTDGISKPKVDSMIGLSPSISVGQHVTNRNPRPNCQHMILPTIDKEEYNEETGFKQFIHCPHCDHRLEKLTRSHFSYNKPEGACETCDGLGKVSEIHLDSVFDQELSLKEGGVKIWTGAYGDYLRDIVKNAAAYYGITLDENSALKELDDVARDLLYYGVEDEKFTTHFPDVKPPKTVAKGKFEGVLTGMWRRYIEKGGNSGEAELFFSNQCPDCKGKRLKKEMREVLVANTSITNVSSFPLEDMQTWLTDLHASLSHEAEEVVSSLTVSVISFCLLRGP